MSDRNTTGIEEFFEPYQAPPHPTVAALLPASVQHATALQNHRAASHVQKVTKDTQSRLRGTSLIDIIDGVGRQMRVIGIPGGTGAPSAFQWQVTINGDGRPTIAPGSLLWPDPLAFSEQTITDYDPVTGWTANRDPANGEFVCFKLTLNSSVEIITAEIDMRNASVDGWYTAGAFISVQYIPIAKLAKTGDVVTVSAQFVSSLPVLERVAIDEFFSFWIR